MEGQTLHDAIVTFSERFALIRMDYDRWRDALSGITAAAVREHKSLTTLGGTMNEVVGRCTVCRSLSGHWLWCGRLPDGDTVRVADLLDAAEEAERALRGIAENDYTGKRGPVGPDEHLLLTASNLRRTIEPVTL